MGKSLLIATGIVALSILYVLGIYLLAKIIGLWIFTIVVAFGINSFN